MADVDETFQHAEYFLSAGAVFVLGPSIHEVEHFHRS